MDGNSTGPAQGQQAQSVFSGQKYNPDQNTTTHYKAGNGNGKKKKQSKCSAAKKKIDGAVVVKADKNKYSNGRQPDYMQASVFKRN